ncbi:MAG: undecaprenyldiphospho-muramoylpentapeptide beta-N-acetylglucosaminyltransferase [Terriglobales bacterium]|jgi:UDP-N-acetylglucosamine--N-acetylmuramyl-(pentapeptide) pyrophosphoryl-undecaprenol N-acetylglucosamine transferase|nr:undecaprenyldiphospho-muramoylpentapeptide beta-N-acetylglucosaminyltransferase [Terriglobales bacterium]
MRAIIAGGGTGGHVIPGLAIAQELKNNYNAEVLFIGTSRGIENRLVPAAGFPLRLVKVGALKNVSVTTRVKTMFDLPRAVWESGRILSEFRPNVVIGVGGYASGPAMLAAILRRVPTLAFEPNVVPGFANRVVARFVSEAAVHFEETSKYFRHCTVTGVPVRQAFFDKANSRIAHHGPTLLVFGGSQGAHAINRAVLESAALLRTRIPQLRIIHQTGERDYNEAQAAYAASDEHAEGEVEVYRFIDDMPSFFGRADLLLCRSGASTVAEIAAAGKPAVFVPFPRAADDHQKRNAEALEKAGAAVMLEESKLTSDAMVEVVASLLGDAARLATMGDAARSLAHPDAARDIAAIAARLAGINQTKAAVETSRKLI